MRTIPPSLRRKGPEQPSKFMMMNQLRILLTPNSSKKPSLPHQETLSPPKSPQTPASTVASCSKVVLIYISAPYSPYPVISSPWSRTKIKPGHTMAFWENSRVAIDYCGSRQTNTSVVQRPTLVETLWPMCMHMVWKRRQRKSKTSRWMTLKLKPFQNLWTTLKLDPVQNLSMIQPAEMREIRMGVMKKVMGNLI